MSNTIIQLIEAENNALKLFNEAEARGYIKSGKTEIDLNKQLYNLAFELFGIKNIGINVSLGQAKTHYILIKKIHQT